MCDAKLFLLLYKLFPQILLLTFVCLFINACGGERPNSNYTDSALVEVVFPPARVVSEDDKILIRGTGSDAVSIATVEVNGLPSVSNDNYATWSIEMPLALGQNYFTVSARDTNENVYTTQIIVRREGTLLRQPLSVAIDELNNRAIIMDSAPYAGGIKAVALDTGVKSVISGGSVSIGSGQSIQQGRGIRLMPEGDRALVIDRNSRSVVAVDLASGNRQTFSSLSSMPGNFDLDEILLDESHDRVLIPAYRGDQIFAVNLQNGLASVFSGASQNAESEINFSRIETVALDSLGNRLIAFDRSEDVFINVDLDSGVRTRLLTANELPSTLAPHEISNILVDDSRNRVLINNYTMSETFALDLSALSFELFSEEISESFLSGGFYTENHTLSAANDAMYLLDARRDRLIKTALESGERELLASNYPIDLENGFNNISDFELDFKTQKAWVSNTDSRELIEVDLTSGVRRVVFSGVAMREMALSADATHIYFINYIEGSLNRLNLSDYSAETVTQNLVYPKHLMLSTNQNLAWVVDDGGLAVVNIDSGVVSRMLDREQLDAGSLRGKLHIDEAEQRMLAISSGDLIAIDMGSGARSVLSDAALLGSNYLSFNSPQDLQYDASQGKAFVVDRTWGRLIEVDVSSGQRKTFDLREMLQTNTFGTNLSNAPEEPCGVKLDLVNNIAVIADKGLESLIYIDLETHHKALLERALD